MGGFYDICRGVMLILCCSLLGSACGEEAAMLPAEPVTEDVQALVFDRACNQPGCHDAASRAGNLDLSNAESSRLGLLDAEPENSAARDSDWRLVAPHNLEISFLYRKITAPGLGEGAGMPIGYQLTPEYVDMVAAWIEAGAP